MSVGTAVGTKAQKSPSIWSSFFGKVAGGISTGLEKVGAEILPNWVSGQATLQAKDQLQSPTYDSARAPNRVETAVQGASRIVETPLFKVGGFQVKSTHALILVGGLLAVWLAVRLGR